MLGMEEHFKEKVYFFIPINKRKANIRDVSSIDGIATNKPMLLSECNSCGNVTAVIIRDSQAIPLIPFLSEHFSKVVYIMTEESPEIIHTIIKKEKPDIVLHEKVERYMGIIFYKNPDV